MRLIGLQGAMGDGIEVGSTPGFAVSLCIIPHPSFPLYRSLGLLWWLKTARKLDCWTPVSDVCFVESEEDKL